MVGESPSPLTVPQPTRSATMALTGAQRQARYRNSKKGKAKIKLYESSPEGKATHKRFSASEKGKLAAAR